MGFRDLTDVLDLSLTLPIRGKDYRVLPPSAQVGLALQQKMALGIVVQQGGDVPDEVRAEVEIDDEKLPDLAHQCLGPVYDEMVKDGLSTPEIEFAVSTAFIAWTSGRQYAEIYWETGGKAQAPASPEQTRSGRTGAAATTTPTQSSGSGTTTRKASARKPRRKA
jgi:hypothetical protein